MSEEKKTSEISTVWEQVYGCQKRNLIKDVFTDIYNQIPDEKKYSEVRKEFTKLLERLWYTAPEIMGARWMDGYKLLRDYIPMTNDAEIDPEWVRKISGIWAKGNIEIERMDGKKLGSGKEGDEMARSEAEKREERIRYLEKKLQESVDSGTASACQLKNLRRSLRRAKSNEK